MIGNGVDLRDGYPSMPLNLFSLLQLSEKPQCNQCYEAALP